VAEGKAPRGSRAQSRRCADERSGVHTRSGGGAGGAMAKTADKRLPARVS